LSKKQKIHYFKHSTTCKEYYRNWSNCRLLYSKKLPHQYGPLLCNYRQDLYYARHDISRRWLQRSVLWEVMPCCLVDMHKHFKLLSTSGGSIW